MQQCSQFLCTFCEPSYATAMLSTRFTRFASTSPPLFSPVKANGFDRRPIYRNTCMSTVDASHVASRIERCNAESSVKCFVPFYRFRVGYSVDIGVIDLLAQGAVHRGSTAKVRLRHSKTRRSINTASSRCTARPYITFPA